MKNDLPSQCVYIFLDEGGNFDFTIKGTRYFSLSCVTIERPFLINPHLDQYKYDCVEWGLPQEYFHCTDDNNYVRKKVFDAINKHLDFIRIDSLLIEKSTTPDNLQDPKHFYPKMLGLLLKYVVEVIVKRNELNEIIIITDNIPINEKRKAIEKTIKQTLTELLPKTIGYRILHHSSRSHYGLQIADYCNWAIFRKWERGETKYYDQIKEAIKSEQDNIYV